MNALKALELGNKYSKCPKCGSAKIGGGAGKVNIDVYFERSCACGWSVCVDENDNPVNEPAPMLLHVAATCTIGKFRILEVHDDKRRFRAYLPFGPLVEKGVAKRISDTKKINAFLQTKAGYEWAQEKKFYSLPI